MAVEHFKFATDRAWTIERLLMLHALKTKQAIDYMAEIERKGCQSGMGVGDGKGMESDDDEESEEN